ncbi:chromosome segregation protein SMC [Cognaticolwellia mytili]|uniref:chromosome segregation protein SMC n=1 Tax=Cognaticolwellia mytili TaxID=1888913 RepID=UPI000A170374|nr:chromosome segregation protein SMC [Cognaticolwellia mytili]
MRLKHIKLAGFKSFVDPTKVPFEKQMTAIVGPNGCGKSNIIDAVRWVLGESSAKNLRGDAMTDVIFNGAASRKPIGQASVELLFDNTQGRIQGNMADRNQVAVRRVVNREGVNTYFLNGSKCRRRDITDIFLGTGLGPRSYAIIEQGTISRLIESKPQELRIFIEEAAGISKYKERRRETETRIRHTRENLARLNDIRVELDVQIDKLHQQSQAAKRFRALKQQERKYKAELAVLRWQKFDLQREQHQKRIIEIDNKIASQNTQISQHELAVIKLKEVVVNCNDSNQALQQQKLNLTQDITRAEQNIKHLKEQATKSQSDNVLTQQQLLNAQQLVLTEQEQLQTCVKKLVEQQPQLQTIETELNGKQNELAEQQSQQKQLHVLWQQQQQKRDDYQQKKLQVHADITQQKTILEQTQSRLEEFNKQLAELPIKNDSVSAEHQKKRNSIVGAIERSRSQVNEFAVDEHQSTTKNQALHQQFSTLTAQQAVKKQIIADINAKLADKSLWSKNQAQWFAEQNNLAYEGIQSQLDVAPGWEFAVEVVLSHLLAGHLIDILPEADNGENLTPATLCFAFNNSKINNPVGSEITVNSLASKISGVSELIPWFNNILLATDYNNAKQQLVNISSYESLICPDGTWLSQYTLRKGKFEQGYDYISLQRHLESEQAQLRSLISEQTILEEQLTKISKLLNKLQQDKIATSASIEQQQNELHQVEKALSLYQQEQQHQQRERESLQSQIDNERKNQANAQQQLASSQQQLAVLSNEGEGVSQDYSVQQSKLQTVIEKIQRRSQELHRQRHQFGLTIEQLKSQQVQREQTIRANQENINILTQRVAANTQVVSESNTPLQEFEQNLPQWLDNLSAINEKLQFNQQALNDSQTQLSALELAAKTSHNKVSTLNEQLARLQLDSEGFKLRAENAMEVLTELQQNIDSVAIEMPAHAKESLWQAQLIKLAKDIQLLGAINLAAIEEYETQFERKNYLDQQDKDLISAIATLESAIAKIDKESRHKFKLTFDQVNNDLQKLFPKVFGGGQAYLTLTGEDLLDTGVTIMARPPGKKNSTIHLLSGGEKALTALSLVFAIFRLNPAPFCLLDEVDAPLDDANVSRFCNLVQEMSKTVQFIYISHNKIAMEMASHLTGVTMFEPGVSRMVAVDIDEAVAMSEA